MRRLGPTLALCAALAAGCGGDDDGGGSDRTVTVPAGAEVRVTAKEYSFDPDKVVVKGAGRLTLTLHNGGSLAHNLKVFKGDEEVGGTPTFQAGKTESGVVNLEHGNYRMLCTVGDHADLGMTAELVVR
jgi:plastocyanin